MVAVPLATGADYSGPAVSECGSAGDVCAGVLRADFSDPAAWIPGWEQVAGEAAERGGGWAALTADSMGLPGSAADSIFPHRFLFIDIVHPNEFANMIIAEQLYGFIEGATGTFFPADGRGSE